jgi:hypothetical protein
VTVIDVDHQVAGVSSDAHQGIDLLRRFKWLCDADDKARDLDWQSRSVEILERVTKVLTCKFADTSHLVSTESAVGLARQKIYPMLLLARHSIKMDVSVIDGPYDRVAEALEVPGSLQTGERKDVRCCCNRRRNLGPSW